MSEPRHTLDEVQRWMQAVVTHPGGPLAAIESPGTPLPISVSPAQVERVIARSQALSSLERLDIYYRAYYARLLDCLREEYSVLAAALEAGLFDKFAVGYLQSHPPGGYTLSRLGARFPEFLAETRPARDSAEEGNADWPEFMIDLARLERVVNEVFDGPGSEGLPALDAARLQAIPRDRWPAVRLVAAPCLRLGALQFPVNVFFTAMSKKESARMPEPGAAFVAVTRRDYSVRRYELSVEQFTLLAALVEGESVGAAIERLVAELPSAHEDLAPRLREWFRTWTAAGFFIAVSLP
ncbi:MAG: putative DNA-binding domain-containing protein [Planctomycetia bacterium]|nr:putative DNA-binding domain-containing protein [Planctomycetia bacterium]